MSLQYRPGIDGLRAFCVLSVMLFHLDENLLPGGFVGVDIFFVISGYLITSILIKDLEKKEFSLSTFYQRRIARIFPVFFLVIFSTLIATSLTFTHRDFAFSGASAFASSISLMNIRLMNQGNYFKIVPDAQPFLHYWSLSIEEQFYLFFPPFLLFLSYLKLKQESIFKILLFILLLSFVSCVALTFYNPTWAFYLLPTRGWELLAGCCLAYYCQFSKTKISPQVANRVGILGFTLMICSVGFIVQGDHFPGWISLLPVLSGVAILGAGKFHRTTIERLLEAKPLVLIGKMSYSLYLWHWPIIAIVDYHYFDHSKTFRFSVSTLLIALSSSASYFWIEKSARNYFNKPNKKAFTIIFGLIAICIFSIVGLTIKKHYYLEATLSSIKNGGVQVNASNRTDRVILIGDSIANCYGHVVRDIANKNNLVANILCVPGAGTPLPDSELWNNSLQFIKDSKPKVVIVGALWNSRLEKDKEILRQAVDELLLYSDSVILLTLQPILPEDANRAVFREKGFHEFIEELSTQKVRFEMNNYVQSLANERVVVVNTEQFFMNANGSIRFIDENGLQNFHDQTHLSGNGANKVMPLLEQEILSILNQRTAP